MRRYKLSQKEMALAVALGILRSQVRATEPDPSSSPSHERIDSLHTAPHSIDFEFSNYDVNLLRAMGISLQDVAQRKS